MAKPAGKPGVKSIAQNRKAFHKFEVLDKLQAGLVLAGTEVKSLREGGVNLGDAYVRPVGDELFLVNCHISEYKNRGYDGHDPLRKRKLLLRRREIKRLIGKIQERGLTVVPLRMYFNERGWAKVEIGLARGKKLHDRRDDMRRRDEEREMARHMTRRR